jgi:uncharacterized protein (UPF0210 family)
MMKIRTITTGFNVELPLKEEQISHIADFMHKARRLFESKGYAVQTVRIATQPWEGYFESRDQIVSLVKELEDLTYQYGLDYSNVGTTLNEKLIPIIYDMMESTSHMFCTVLVSDDKTIRYERARQTAKLMKELSRIDKDGFTNLRFAAIFNTKPGSPFYPAAYHEGPTSFAIGTENSDLVNKAFARAKTIEEAAMYLREVLAEEFKRIEEIALEISVTEKVKYDGIDVSIATSVVPDESIAYAFERLGLGRFGDVGTLAIAKIITDTVKGLPIKKCGYSGLMLPVLEDYGLAERNNEGTFNLGNLLLYSSVCGTGLDTIPLPGDISEKKLFALLLDIASLSIALDKPLSARLMPIPGKRIGEMTQYQFEYFANSKIMKI